MYSGIQGVINVVLSCIRHCTYKHILCTFDKNKPCIVPLLCYQIKFTKNETEFMFTYRLICFDVM